MLTIEHPAADTTTRAARAPRITPVHDPVERRQGDLVFNVDTGGRPCYRVLIARERSLFAPEQAGARNASNFYDSLRDGLLPDDGPPSLYLVPRAVLHAMLPAARLYYTLIAYEDRGGTQAVYAHPPESLARAAPSVGIASDLTAQSLGLMFGTPVQRLLRVGSSGLAWEQASEEVGEDLEAELPQEIGLAADEGEMPAEDDDAVAEAAAYDAEEVGEDLLPEQASAEQDGDPDGYEGGDAGDPGAMAWAAADESELRMPVMEAALGAADEDGDPGWDQDPAPRDAPVSLADDYDDGYGLPDPAQAPEPAAQGFALGHEEPYAQGRYGAEHEQGEAQAWDSVPHATVPAMLPDEDADHAAQAGAHDEEDEVEIEPPAQAQALALAATPVNGARRPFDIEACKALLARIMPFESGDEGFTRVGPDGEFAGRYGTAHPAYQRYHLGLSFGGFPFVQEHGTLGQLLALMRERDRAGFERIFGAEAEALIATTTTSEGPRAWQAADGLSPRLRPVGGAPLWQEPWLGRFRAAGAHPPFQGAQNEMAARLYVQPVLPAAAQLGLDSEQALTLMVDRAVQLGPEAALAWVLEAVSPLQTPAQRQQALARLGHADLRAFQAAQRLPDSGAWDTATHAALIAALRGRPDTPVPIPTREQMVEALLRHAEGAPWSERMKRLRAASAADRLFQL